MNTKIIVTAILNYAKVSLGLYLHKYQYHVAFMIVIISMAL